MREAGNQRSLIITRHLFRHQALLQSIFELAILLNRGKSLELRFRSLIRRPIPRDIPLDSLLALNMQSDVRMSYDRCHTRCRKRSDLQTCSQA